jgi:hypothetical protein
MADLHFIANYTSGEDIEQIRSLEWQQGSWACATHTWTWPVYCQLKMRGYDVSLGYELKKEAINVIHRPIAEQLIKTSDLKDYFIIVVRADFRPFRYGQFEIVQNQQSAGRNRVYMPLYSQPGLLERAPSRTQVKNICFAGELQNSVVIQSAVEALGCTFVHKGIGEWHDLRDVDILVGIRSFSKHPHYSKPPTKLFNAWLAGIPFIGGYDSAYEQVGIPGENYLRVASYEELLEAIKRLKNDPALYKHLVEAGKKAGESYTPDKITDMWIDFFEARVVPEFSKWTRGDRRLHFFANLKAELFSVEQFLRKKMRRRKGASSNEK